MQEFSSVTASSYDADALAPLLSAKSAEGWDVISIVSAGTNIVAYLSRESSGEDTGEIDTPVFAGGDTETAEQVTEPDEAVIAEAELEEAATDDSALEDVAEIEAVEDEIQVPSDPTPIATSAVVADAVEPEPAIDEPAGWGSAPEETAPAAEETSVADLAAQVAEPEPVVEEPATVESTVPAGWYADPSGRYELRYWDGSAWTEHVSRAGQQFTDPPVA